MKEKQKKNQEIPKQLLLIFYIHPRYYNVDSRQLKRVLLLSDRWKHHFEELFTYFYFFLVFTAFINSFFPTIINHRVYSAIIYHFIVLLNRSYLLKQIIDIYEIPCSFFLLPIFPIIFFFSFMPFIAQYFMYIKRFRRKGIF